MKTIKANKTNLNKIIKWSSSRFNEYKKNEVIDRILQAIKKGEDYEQRFGTGAFTERNCWGWAYIIKIQNGTATLRQDVTGEMYLLLGGQEK